MSQIAEFSAKMTAFNSSLEQSLEGLSDDVAVLNATIKELQDSAGTVTPADQKLIDDLVITGQSLAERFTALDELTPPPVPPVA